MKKTNILITGANGQLGHEMRNVLADDPRFHAIFTDVTGDDIVKLDITDEPKGAKEAARLDQYFSDDYFEFLGDTLSFRISIEPKDKTKADSASADTNAVQANKKFYNFKVLKETLKQDTTRILKTEGATIGLHYLHASQWSETERSLKIKGLLFIE